ncbi:MAG: hypothetical protein WAW37_01425 [Syntrophobacteraceae bacterium]
MGENKPLKRIMSGACRLFCATWAWVVKFVKTKFQECKRCKAQKNMDERVKRLGTEIYSLHKQGETELLRSQAVVQQLKLVEEAEARLFEIYDKIEALDLDYRQKRQDIAQCGKTEE